ncbi:MAG: IS1595 family transposase [Candidatus Aenigmatarchaeota archaeon]
MPRIPCPKCGSKIGYAMKSGYRRCSSCRYDWNPNRMPLRLSKFQWKGILVWFMRGQSAKSISEETGINRLRVIRTLMRVRMAMKTDIPEQFSGIVEVDETYLGGQWKNKPKATRKKGTKRGRGTNKQPVFGIYARNGIVWAELVDDSRAKTLQPLIKKQVVRGSTVYSDTWKGYTGIATKGYVHRMVDHSKEYVNKGVHINGLEGFWGYLKRQLAAKGGIRRERLGLYLGEYVWRYNNRKLTLNDQVKKLLVLLKYRRVFGGGNDT